MDINTDRRKLNRHITKMMGGHAAEAMYLAYGLGEADAYRQRPNRNPYPPGRRHDEYERSYNSYIHPDHTRGW